MLFGLLDEWMRSRQLKDIEHKQDLQLRTINGQQDVVRIQSEIKKQELEIANSITDLRYKISMNDASVQLKLVEIQKEHDQLEQVKAKFRLYLDEQRLDMDLKRERFDREQDRADKELNNSFALQMATLELRKKEQDNHHAVEMRKLDIEKEERLYQRIKQEENKAEQALLALKAEQEQARLHQHEEKRLAIELEAKRFEMMLASIRILATDMQEAGFADLRKQMLEKINNFKASDSSITEGY